MSLITLTTDFGTRDHYVAALKGVILSISPGVRIVDITHDVEPHDIHHAAFVLRQSWPWYPAGTVHVVVVDPGVGTERRILLAQYGEQFVIAPDNGVVTLVHRAFAAGAVYVVENTKFFLPNVADTFHGRDIMAPVAAHLTNGVKPVAFGRSTDRIEILPSLNDAQRTADLWQGIVIHVDRFGTMVTNISAEQLSGFGPTSKLDVFVNGHSIGTVRRTFADVRPSEPLALIGGTSYLEIAVNQGRAIDRFGPAESARIEVRISPM